MSVFKHQKTGRWVSQIYDVGTGKKRQIGTYATRREADAALRAEQGKKPRSAMTITEWRTVWLSTGFDPDREPEDNWWKESTHVHYAERTAAFERVHGKMRLTSFNRTMARAFLAENKSSWDTLRIMFGAAQHEDNEHGDRLLQDNPFARLVKKTNARRDLQADWLTPEDMDRLEACAAGSSPGMFGAQLAAMVRFAAETGVRPGELFAVEWGDLDFDAGTVTIRRAVNSKTRKLDAPKNGRGREIVLSQRAQLAVGSFPRWESERVFNTTRGERWHSPTWTYHWKPIRNAFGRPTMAWYELRHYCCTRLLGLGVSAESAAIQLGHTDGGELVRRVYGHESSRRALDNVRRAMDGEPTYHPPGDLNEVREGLRLVEDEDAA